MNSSHAKGTEVEHDLCRECGQPLVLGTEVCPHCDAPDPFRDLSEESSRERIKRSIKNTKEEYHELGGWHGLTRGEWLWKLINKSLGVYIKRANAEYFRKKYPNLDNGQIAKKLISVAARNAAILGGLTGSAISADEIGGLLALPFGVGVPVNLAIAAGAIGAEAILLARIQIQMIVNLSALYDVPLDPEDPEDILTILAFALGGSAAEAAGKAGMKIGGAAAGQVARQFFSKEVLALVKKVGAKVGIKILQKSIVKYTIPIASIGIGTGWNYLSTKAVGSVAIKHVKKKRGEFGLND